MTSTAAVVLAALGMFVAQGHELSGLVEDTTGKPLPRRADLAIDRLEPERYHAHGGERKDRWSGQVHDPHPGRGTQIRTVADDALGLGLPAGRGTGAGPCESLVGGRPRGNPSSPCLPRNRGVSLCCGPMASR